jgi:hypothetical protein
MSIFQKGYFSYLVTIANSDAAKSGMRRGESKPKIYRKLIDHVQINYRMRVTLNDGRQMTGQMLAFDKVRLDHF